MSTDIPLIDVCRICGMDFTQSKQGRAKQYCSEPCKLYYKYYNALEKSIAQIMFKDRAHKKSVVGDLFSLVNSLHNRKIMPSPHK